MKEISVIFFTATTLLSNVALAADSYFTFPASIAVSAASAGLEGTLGNTQVSSALPDGLSVTTATMTGPDDISPGSLLSFQQVQVGHSPGVSYHDGTTVVIIRFSNTFYADLTVPGNKWVAQPNQSTGSYYCYASAAQCPVTYIHP